MVYRFLDKSTQPSNNYWLSKLYLAKALSLLTQLVQMINKGKLTLLKPTCPLLSVPVVGGIDVVGGGRDWTAGGALLATGAAVPGVAAPGAPPLLAAAAWLVSSVSWCVRAWIWDIMLLSRKAAGTAAGLVISFCFLSSCWSCCSCCSCCCCWWYKMTI